MSSTGKNIRLGVFVVTGTVFLVMGLYFIGSKRNLFGSTFRISAQFHNVNGLMAGNNVRFAGINVGTVEKVRILSDSLVDVIMLIEFDARPFIRKNAIATVGTEGLMGNKLVNINSVGDAAEPVEEGDVLGTLRPIEGDEMLRTLNTTNENVKVMSQNLRTISQRFERENGFWALLTDTVVAANVRASILNIRDASDETARAAESMRQVAEDIQDGGGVVGALVTDDSLAIVVEGIIGRLREISDTASAVTRDLAAISSQLRSGDGTLGMLLNDTAFARTLVETMDNVERGTRGFEENMAALRHSWPFKKYFKKQAKEK